MLAERETYRNEHPARRDLPPPSHREPALRPRAAWYLSCKAAAEFALALGLMVLTAPLILLAAVLVKLTSPGPVFYSQTRVGKNGRPFTIYKIRTMFHNCEGLTGARWST